MTGVNKKIAIIGAGLAGCEAAWHAASAGIEVTLFEMKPKRFSPAHSSENFAELVCSNSLRSASADNAVGVLKEEMRTLGSLVMMAADETRVPAGKALAVDRDLFSKTITEKICAHKNIHIVREEVELFGPLLDSYDAIVIASGPLTSPALEAAIRDLTSSEYLYFYDSIAPLIEADSIDKSKVFRASRYGYGESGEGDYLNFSLSFDEYYILIGEFLKAEKIKAKAFDDPSFFEGCMPIEEMAKTGPDTLRHGPMKPMGLVDPKLGKPPYAVVQLRQDNLEGSLYNMVGFQSRMTWPEQDRVFRLIPGLEMARFVRYGTMHRNTFINGPALLDPYLRLTSDPRFFFIGQLTGVEGYVESAASGLYVGKILPKILNGEAAIFSDGAKLSDSADASNLSINQRKLQSGDSDGANICGAVLKPPPPTTAIGALIRHATNSSPRSYQPSNIIFGLMPPLEHECPKAERRQILIRRAREDFKTWVQEALKCPINQ